jgi:hypothetical protein
MEGVQADGGDGSVYYSINDENAAIEKIKSFSDSTVAYLWHTSTNRLIEKDPSLKTATFDEIDGVFFLYADKKLRDEW